MEFATTVHPRLTKSVTLLGAKRQETGNLGAIGLEHAGENRERGDAIHIVIAIKDNALALPDGLQNPLHGERHFGEGLGRGEQTEARMKLGLGGGGVRESAAHEKFGEESGHTEFRAEFRHGPVVGIRGKNPAPGHGRQAASLAEPPSRRVWRRSRAAAVDAQEKSRARLRSASRVRVSAGSWTARRIASSNAAVVWR